MEDVLVHAVDWMIRNNIQCLNPCCSGRCSSTRLHQPWWATGKSVLILVVVEDVLVLNEEESYKDWSDRLNPCCSGRCSST